MMTDVRLSLIHGGTIVTAGSRAVGARQAMQVGGHLAQDAPGLGALSFAPGGLESAASIATLDRGALIGMSKSRADALRVQLSGVPVKSSSMENHGSSGDMSIVDIADPNGVLPVQRAIEKPAYGGGVEAVVSDGVAQALGLQRYVPPTAAMPDTNVRVGFLPGREYSDEDVARGGMGFALVERMMADRYAQRGGLTPERAARFARIDSQLLQFKDWLLANFDRNSWNVRFDDEQKLVGFIDEDKVLEAVFRGEGKTIPRDELLRPVLVAEFQERSGATGRRQTVELLPEVVDIIRANLNHGLLEQVRNRALAPVDLLTPNQRNMLLNKFSPESWRGVHERLQHALDTGAYSYRAMAPDGRLGDNAGVHRAPDFGNIPVG